MAEKMLSEKLGEVEYDGLIAGVNPKKRVGPGVIAGPEAETTFVRGTVFAKSAKDGKLHILGTEASGGDTLTADCILIEDVTMKASMDETVAVYLAGCFNPDKLTVKDSYYNMKKCIEPCMYVVERAKKAMAAAGMNPVEVPIRGGTDGARLSYEGLPCPNLCTGGENYHGRFEFIPAEDMEKCVRMLVEILTA